MDLNVDVARSFDRMDHWKRLLHQYHQPTKKSEQYEKWKEENPARYPSPQQYFKMKTETFDKKKAKEQEKLGWDEEKKNFYSDHKKVDKRIFKPMKGHIF